MASEIPVLPLVGSKMVDPGRSWPEASATRIMLRAARSLMEPVGLRSSSFAQSRTDGLGESDGNPTSGVCPTAPAKELYRVTAGGPFSAGPAGDGRQHDHDVTVGGRSREPAGEPDVLVVDVDVDEAPQVVGLDQSRLEPRVAAVDVVDHLLQGRARTLDRLLAAGERPQNRWDPHLYRHDQPLLAAQPVNVGVNAPS